MKRSLQSNGDLSEKDIKSLLRRLLTYLITYGIPPWLNRRCRIVLIADKETEALLNDILKEVCNKRGKEMTGAGSHHMVAAREADIGIVTCEGDLLVKVRVGRESESKKRALFYETGTNRANIGETGIGTVYLDWKTMDRQQF
jgi:hypothetical protein